MKPAAAACWTFTTELPGRVMSTCLTRVPAQTPRRPGATQVPGLLRHSRAASRRYFRARKYWLNGFSIGSRSKLLNPASSATVRIFDGPMQAP